METGANLSIDPKTAAPLWTKVSFLPKHLRFLIAHENSDVRRTICSILQEMGFSRIEERREYEEFCRTLKADRIDCLICGPVALQRNRSELLHLVQERETLRSVIVVGGGRGDSRETISEDSRAFVQDYVPIPFSIRYFEDRVRAAILGERNEGTNSC